MKYRTIVFSFIFFIFSNILWSEPNKINEIVDNKLKECVLEAVGKGERINEIKMLNCENRQIEKIDGIQILYNLEKLDLSGNRIFDLSDLVNLKKLKELNLSDCLPSKEKSNDSKYPSLKMDAIDLSKIVNMKSLTRLSLSRCNLSNISTLKSDSIKDLDVSFNYIIDVAFIKRIPNVSTLNVSYNQIKDYAPFFEIPMLEVLSLNGNNIKSVTLRKQSILRELYISDNYLSDLSFISFMPKLQVLEVLNNCLANIPKIKVKNKLLDYMRSQDSCKNDHLKESMHSVYGSYYIGVDKKMNVIDIANDYMKNKLNLTGYEKTTAKVSFLRKGKTSSVRNVCDNSNAKCEIVWSTYNIEKPLWEVVLNNCHSEPCLGGIFIMYIDDYTKKVLYYGGYK